MANNIEHEIKTTEDEIDYVLSEIELHLERGWGFVPLKDLNEAHDKLTERLHTLETASLKEAVDAALRENRSVEVSLDF